MMSRSDHVSDDVSTSCQYISKIVIVDGMEAPRKVTRKLYGFKWLIWQQPWQRYVTRPYDAPGAYQCFIAAALIIGTSISIGHVIWLGYTRLYLVYKTNCWKNMATTLKG